MPSSLSAGQVVAGAVEVGAEGAVEAGAEGEVEVGAKGCVSASDVVSSDNVPDSDSSVTVSVGPVELSGHALFCKLSFNFSKTSIKLSIWSCIA